MKAWGCALPFNSFKYRLKRMTTRETAKQAVEAIAAKLGYVDLASLDRIGELFPEERRIIEEGLRIKDENIGHSIKAFVTYSTCLPATQGVVC